jgi:DNA-binding transcriptional MocR family regulator
VWFVSSLSKSVSAGLRFGWVVCPTGLGERARMAAQHAFFGLPRPVTDIVGHMLGEGAVRRLAEDVQRVFDGRLGIALNTLGWNDIAWQKGLSFFWMRLPSGWRASTFAREAEARGVLIRSADEYALVDGHAPNAVRIALAGGVPEQSFAAAMTALAQLLENPPGDIPV